MLRRLEIFGLSFGLLIASYSSMALRDPTMPLTPTDARMKSTHGMEVTSILISPHRRVAYVNGSAVIVGDTVSDAKVIAIKPHAVYFQDKDGKKFSVPIYQTVVKPPSKPKGGPVHAPKQNTQ